MARNQLIKNGHEWGMESILGEERVCEKTSQEDRALSPSGTGRESRGLEEG